MEFFEVISQVRVPWRVHQDFPDNNSKNSSKLAGLPTTSLNHCTFWRTTTWLPWRYKDFSEGFPRVFLKSLGHSVGLPQGFLEDCRITIGNPQDYSEGFLRTTLKTFSGLSWSPQDFSEEFLGLLWSRKDLKHFPKLHRGSLTTISGLPWRTSRRVFRRLARPYLNNYLSTPFNSP